MHHMRRVGTWVGLCVCRWVGLGWNERVREGLRVWDCQWGSASAGLCAQVSEDGIVRAVVARAGKVGGYHHAYRTSHADSCMRVGACR